VKLKKPLVVCKSGSQSKPMLTTEQTQKKHSHLHFSRPAKRLKRSHDSHDSKAAADNNGRLETESSKVPTSTTLYSSSVNSADGILDVLGVVRYKYLFKSRPRLVVGSRRMKTK